MKNLLHFLESRTRILEHIIEGEDLIHILNVLCLDTEAYDSSMKCSIFFLDSDTMQIHHAAAPSLPEYYTSAIDGLDAKMGVVSCGTAAFTGEQVIVEDVFNHPYWKPHLELAKKVGFHACWSQPIYSKNKKVLGTFAMYFNEVRHPSSEDMALIHTQVQLASLVIERLNTENALKDSEVKVLAEREELESRVIVRTSEFDNAKTQAETDSALLRIAKKDLEHQKSAMDAHSLVSSTDIKGIITYVNQKFCDVSGYTKEELLGGNHRLLNSDNQPKNYWRDMYLTCSKGNNWHDQVRNKNKAGNYYWVDTTIVPVFDNENLSGYMSIRTDITSQEHLTIAKAEAEAASVAKTQFLSTMSHEIRTPMNGVIGMAQLLKDTPLTPEQKDYVDTITRSGNGLLTIINDILDFSKLDADKLEIENITFDLERVCQESMELIVGNFKGKSLEFIFDYPPDCPRHFLGDPSRIRQILLNLLSNAVKFTERGFIRCGVSYELSDKGEEQLRLEVQDTGIGLKPDTIERLFDKFTQADSATTRLYGGTGLGLAITKNLVGLMGGVIGVNSVDAEGSTFWITGILTPTKRLEPTIPKPLKDVRILFVNEVEENRRIFKRLLEHMGAKATIISDPTQVEELLVVAEKSKAPFEIAILDQKMTKLSGLELGLKIRKHNSLADLKLLIFTSVGQKGDAALFETANFNGYLDKLSRCDTFRDILSSMLTHTTGNTIVTHHTIEDAKSNIANEPQNINGSILIVEDNITNQIIAKKLMVSMGLTVDIVNNGQEGVEAYNSKNYDLIFMDCRMPVMDGYEATVAIRDIEQEKGLTPTPIIALTANVSSDDRILCEESGMNAVVTKPFKRADLSKALIEWLQTGACKTDPTPVLRTFN